MLAQRKKTPSMTQEIIQSSLHKYDSDSEPYLQFANLPIKDSTLDYRINDTPQNTFQQLIESNNATTEFCQVIFKKLQNIERQNQILLDIIQNEMGCEEVLVPFADEGLTDEQVKERVLTYYQTKGESYPSDVAFALNFDLKRVVNAVYQLEEEGVLEG